MRNENRFGNMWYKTCYEPDLQQNPILVVYWYILAKQFHVAVFRWLYLGLLMRKMSKDKRLVIINKTPARTPYSYNSILFVRHIIVNDLVFLVPVYTIVQFAFFSNVCVSLYKIYCGIYALWSSYFSSFFIVHTSGKQPEAPGVNWHDFLFDFRVCCTELIQEELAATGFYYFVKLILAFFLFDSVIVSVIFVKVGIFTFFNFFLVHSTNLLAYIGHRLYLS